MASSPDFSTSGEKIEVGGKAVPTKYDRIIHEKQKVLGGTEIEIEVDSTNEEW